LDAEFWLGRTTDGARTWTNVTPPAFEALQAGVVDTLASTSTLEVYALDAETAWAYTSCFTSTGQCPVATAIWRTEDGGRSWQVLNIPTACRAEQLDCIPDSVLFVDREHGWLMMALVERNYLQFDYYRTTDGGQTWEALPRLKRSINTQFINRPTLFDEQFGLKLPFGLVGDPIDKIKTGALFSLEATYDGGYTWKTRTLPAPEGLLEVIEAQLSDEDQTLLMNFSIVAAPDETGAVGLGVKFRLSGLNTPWIFQAGYFSRDRGLTWQVLSQPGDAFTLDQETAWRLADRAGMLLEKTTDGGATWEPFPQVSWELEYDPSTRKIIKLIDGGAVRTEIPTQFLVDRLWPGQGLRLESLHMQSALEGWAVEIGGVTLCTEDGAHTWQPCAVPEELAIPAEAELPDTEGTYSPDEPLPDEMFHGGPVPTVLQGWMENGQQFLPDIHADDVYFNPFAYFCKTQNVDPMGGSRIGIARRCLIRYPTEEGRVYFYLAGYWMYYYSVTIRDAEQQVWPNVVDIDFVDEVSGWRLLDNGTGLFRLEATEDGGDTWRWVKTVAWLGPLEFVSAEEGFALAFEPPKQGIRSEEYIPPSFRPASLLYTTDGGQTWQEILPVIGSDGN
jgi:photosystem II stability/assembly factor-like uncharacterized protein